MSSLQLPNIAHLTTLLKASNSTSSATDITSLLKQEVRKTYSPLIEKGILFSDEHSIQPISSIKDGKDYLSSFHIDIIPFRRLYSYIVDQFYYTHITRILTIEGGYINKNVYEPLETQFEKSEQTIQSIQQLSEEKSIHEDIPLSTYQQVVTHAFGTLQEMLQNSERETILLAKELLLKELLFQEKYFYPQHIFHYTQDKTSAPTTQKYIEHEYAQYVYIRNTLTNLLFIAFAEIKQNLLTTYGEKIPYHTRDRNIAKEAMDSLPNGSELSEYIIRHLDRIKNEYQKNCANFTISQLERDYLTNSTLSIRIHEISSLLRQYFELGGHFSDIHHIIPENIDHLKAIYLPQADDTDSKTFFEHMKKEGLQYTVWPSYSNNPLAAYKKNFQKKRRK